MTQFTYQAKNEMHQSVNGTVEADSLDAAVNQVIGLGFVPLDIRPVEISQGRTSTKNLNLSFGFRKVQRTQVVFFIRQISDLISAGVNVLRALTLTARQTRHPYFKEIITGMSEQVRDGGTLSESMARYPDVFPKVYVNLLKAGEASGKLGEVLSRLAELAQRDLDTRSQIVAALIYPCLILIVGTITILALLTWVVPKLTGIFEDFDQALPTPTLVLIGMSDFILKFWLLLIALVVMAVAGLYRIKTTAWGRLWFDRIKLSLPVLGGLIHSVEIGRFARTMATLLGNGVSMITALEVTSQVMGHELIRQEVMNVVKAVSQGSSLNGALKKSNLFPESVVTMVAVGEESGQIHQGLARMAEFFENQAQRTMKTITALIEPVLILVLGMAVGFVVLAMLMPLVRMNSIIQ